MGKKRKKHMCQLEIQKYKINLSRPKAKEARTPTMNITVLILKPWDADVLLHKQDRIQPSKHVGFFLPYKIIDLETDVYFDWVMEQHL